MLSAQTADPPRDCQQCGACCVLPFVHGPRIGFVPLTSRDLLRLPPGYREQTVEREGRTYMPVRPTPDGLACLAFRGRVGNCCACAIYVPRPDVCRYYPIGGTSCSAVREAHGLF